MYYLYFADSFMVYQNQEYVVAINNSVTLNATANGPGSEHFKYQWGKMGNNTLPSTASGQGTSILTFTALTMDDDGSYYCTVTNQWGTTVKSNVGLVRVLSKCM